MDAVLEGCRPTAAVGRWAPALTPDHHRPSDRCDSIRAQQGTRELGCFCRGAIDAAPGTGIRYATDVLPKTVQQWALDRIEWHKSQGDDVLVVSASLDIYLGPWCRARNLAYVCTTLEEPAHWPMRSRRLFGSREGTEDQGAL